MAPLVLAFTAALARLVIAQPRRQCVSQGLVRLLQWFDSCAGTLTSPGAAGMPRLSLFLGALAVAWAASPSMADNNTRTALYEVMRSGLAA